MRNVRILTSLYTTSGVPQAVRFPAHPDQPLGRVGIARRTRLALMVLPYNPLTQAKNQILHQYYNAQNPPWGAGGDNWGRRPANVTDVLTSALVRPILKSENSVLLTSATSHSQFPAPIKTPKKT